MANLRYFTPLNGKIVKRSFVAFDCEGVGGRDGFWCGAAWDESGGHSFSDADQLWQYLASAQHGGAWRVAHNLEYDLAVLGIDRLFSGGAIYSPGGLLWYNALDDRGNEIRFVDSLQLFRNLSVASLGKLAGCEKLPEPPGVFAALRAGYPLAEVAGDLRDRLIAYNLRDAEIVYLAMTTLQETVNSLGGGLRETIAATSHDLFRRVYMARAWRTVGPKTNEAAREAYYGGRSESVIMGRMNGANLYDANSLYPYVMSVERFPNPAYLDVDVPGTLPGDFDRREGVAHVDVEVGPCKIPPLPLRLAGSLFFPVGRWKGTYTLNELRHALACGVTIHRVEWMISARVTFNPFADFVRALWERRQAARALSDPAEQVVKMLLNSHIGRYGVRADVPLTTIDLLTRPIDPDKDRGLLWDELWGWQYLERPLEQRHSPLYANAFIAAQVAAGARVCLHRMIHAHEDSTLYYDTDSLITTDRLVTGTGLGEWKCLMFNGEADLVGPKEYAIIREYERAFARAKGIPRRLVLDYIRTGQVRFERALKMREAKARGMYPGVWVETLRTHGDPTPKRAVLPKADPDQSWYPTEAWSVESLFPELGLVRR